MKEKRAFTRLKVYHLAKYRLISGGKEMPALVMASLKDISAGGACLRVEEYLPKDTLIELKINLPMLDNPVSCRAQVMWIRSIASRELYELGVQFQDMDPATRKAIDEGIKFVQEKLSRKL
jgi:c-di-GMP-binding flagellar brake protein YcgR